MILARWKSLGPIIMSALSVLIITLLLQPLACWLDPTWTLLSSRGMGKIALTSIVIFHILLLTLIQPKKFLRQWYENNIKFLGSFKWIKTFVTFFLAFFILHSLLLVSFFSWGFLSYNPSWGVFKPTLLLRILFGFIVTFFLAWTEELIFRGTIYPFLVQQRSMIESIFLTSLIFMLCHDLVNPLNLITVHWRMGLGLFSLGFLLNLLFALSEKLYVGMGVHAGLVFVKVILRRARFLLFLPAAQLPWWIHSDLRQSLLVHALFAGVNISLVIIFRKQLFRKSKIESSDGNIVQPSQTYQGNPQITYSVTHQGKRNSNNW